MMMILRCEFCVAALLCLLSFSGCQSETSSETREKVNHTTPVVVVVNYPLEFIVTSLGGDHFEVINPVPPGANPETWLPDDKETQTIQSADLIVTNGANFADWVKKLSLPRSRVLRTSLSIKDALITVPDFEVHSHGDGGAHSHAGTVAFFWLDPTLMKRQAQAIAERLIQLDPSQKELISSNLASLEKSLQPLSDKLDQLKTTHPGLHWFSTRPVYQYLARHCDWQMHHLHWKENTDPTEADWDKLKSLQKEHPVSLMLWEHQPDNELIKKLEAARVKSFVLDPLTVQPAKGNYLTQMTQQLNELEQFLKTQSAEKAESTQ